VGAYGSCKFYQIDDGTRIVSISYSHLYWYREEELKNLNQIEYFSVIKVWTDWPEKNDKELPHTQYKPDKSKTYKLDKGIEIWANHHQVLVQNFACHI
jgi:hypothetical protein